MSDSFVTLWTEARQVPLSMGFSRQEYWSGLPFPSPGDLPDPGIKPVSCLAFFATQPPDSKVILFQILPLRLLQDMNIVPWAAKLLIFDKAQLWFCLLCP